MTRYGYTLLSETHHPRELVDEGLRAEAAGFDFLVVSDHFHPWLDSHGHSPFAWSVLGSLATSTTTVDLATMVTCPFLRYHPAVIAQAAATVGALSDGRFTLGLGAGEQLNEHVVGEPWPSVRIRHDMLRESIEAMQALWSEDWVTYDGEHVHVEDARLFDVPDGGIDVFVGASGQESATLAAEQGAGLCLIEPDDELVTSYRSTAGDGAATWGQVPLSWDADDAHAAKLAHERFRFGALGWKVMAELPNVVNFEAATRSVREEDVTKQMPAGSDPERMAKAVREFVDAGIDNVAVLQVGDDIDGFLSAWTDEIRPMLP
jgi:G6PDH family F420-dependent oxidoreductase